MFKLSNNDVKKEYDEFKAYASKLFVAGKYEQSLNYIHRCSATACNFNFTFIDNDLEKLLIDIGNKILLRPIPEVDGDRYVFYDYFGYDNRGLTQQYIRALIALKKEFLYILDIEGSEGKGNDIIAEINAYDKAAVYFIPNGPIVDKLLNIEKIVCNYNPSTALLHFAPWDVTGVTFWTKFKIKRYFINLTDHAFWLGVNSADYFLEFRTFGRKISMEARGIEENKLLLQPYYPIQKHGNFLGFPKETEKKIIGFSGAHFYKVYGREGKFFDLIKRALNENENFVFLFAGSGDAGPINEFIKENNFYDRFILLGDRPDINEVFNHIDIFVNTYPVIGALMTQLAVVNKKPLVTFTTPDLACNLIEDFLNVNKNKVKSMCTEDDFAAEINMLISDPNYRLQNVNNYKDSVPTAAEFNERLAINLSHPHMQHPLTEASEINYNAIADLYLETENDFLRQHDYLTICILKSSYFRHFPIKATMSLIKALVFQNKVIIKKVRDKFR